MDNEQLVIRIKAGIDAAENMLQLWQQNQGYVFKIVNSYREYGEEEDLRQEGYLGLSEAVSHYNQDEGTPFITYAGYWIRQRIVRYIKGNGTVRLPEHMQGRIRKYKAVLAKWQRDLGRRPSEMEICGFMDIDEEMLRCIEKAARMGKIGSLDVPVGEDEDCTFYDLLPGTANEEEQVLEKIQKEQLCSVLWPLVDSLPGQQPETLRARYQEGRTLKEIAQERGTTFEAVWQQEQKGLRELRKPSKSRQLRLFLEEDRLYSRALQGNGVGTFQRTWTSSTERAALWEELRKDEEEMLQRMREGS